MSVTLLENKVNYRLIKYQLKLLIFQAGIMKYYSQER